MMWNPCQKSHVVSNGHTWSKKARPEKHGTKFQHARDKVFLHARQSFRMGDKRFDNG